MRKSVTIRDLRDKLDMFKSERLRRVLSLLADAIEGQEGAGAALMDLDDEWYSEEQAARDKSK